MNRRKLLKNALGSSALLAFGVPTLAQQKSKSIPVDLSKRKVPKIKITKFDVIMTGQNEFVRLETDAGIVGYGDATNHFLPYSVEGMLEQTDQPLAIGERYHKKWDCRETIENQYVNYLRPDINHCGGITVNEEAAANIPFAKPTMQPHLNGIDGSVRDF